MRCVCRHFLVAVMLVGVVSRADGEGAPIAISVRTVDQEQVRGRLAQFSLDQGLHLRRDPGEVAMSVPARDVVDIRVMETSPHQADSYCVFFDSGQRLYGRLTGHRPDQIVLDTLMGEAVSIPLERVQALLTPRAWEPAWQDVVFELVGAAASDDRIVLSNGDRLSGWVVDISPERLAFEYQERMVELELESVVAVILGGETPPSPSEGLRARVTFVDGSVLLVPQLHWTPESLHLSFFDGTVQLLPTDVLRGIEVRNGRWVWLSELDLLSAVHLPLLSVQWPARINRDVTGGSLSIAGRQFQHGIGVHARSVVSYDLGGQYSQFVSWCGIDDSGGALADVVVEVMVDDTSRWRCAGLGADSEPQLIRIDVSGGNRLQLIVDYGRNYDLQDRFNWADAALVRPY